MGGYARYIATREGVEKIDDSHRHAPATQKQQKLIEKILRDFPDAKNSHEYEDYLREKTVGNASEFITQAIEENMDKVADSKTYADYIATRPRAERFGSHGLFTDDGVQVQLSKVSEELNHYSGHVYTTILSMRREDAARLGFDTGSRWRDFLRGQTQTLSENLKIPMEHLRWYAAYHNEGHHPHVHLIAYSSVPGEGYLSEQGVEKIRSEFARDIFAQELICTYEQQTGYRDQLRQQGRESVAEIVEQINAGNYRNAKVEELLVKLSDRLSRTSGKKQYGYLKADMKAIVDQIVMELAADEKIQKLYDLWYEQREDVLRTYTDTFPERIPLEQNKEFKSIRNAVIQEAMKITARIQQAASVEPQLDELKVELPTGEELLADPAYWQQMFQPVYAPGNEQLPADYKEAEQTLAGERQGTAAYLDGKAYLEEGRKDMKKAISQFQKAAEKGNSYAEYQLGKIYYFGNGVKADPEKGLEYLEASADHGNVYAAELLRTIQYQHTWGAAMAANSLMGQLARLFQEQSQRQEQSQQLRTDRKLRRQIDEKKQALGIRD